MPTVYQPATFKPIPAAASRSTDPATGRRFAAWTARGGRKVRAEITPDGNRCKVKSPTWWVEYTDDKGKRVRVPGYRDRAATLDLAARLQRKARAVRGGYDTPGEDSDRSGPRPLADYLPDFRTDLELAGSGRQHVLNVVMHVTETVRALRLTTAASVDCRKVARWLRAEQLRLGWAAETHNRWVQHLRQFGLWLVSIDRAARNPFAGLARVPVAARSRTRRRIDHEHLGVLLATVRDLRGVNHGLTGPERASLYLVASYTGFRRGALASLTPESVAWDDTPGRSGGLPVSVTVAAKAAKNKKPHTVPLHPDVAAELAPWLRTRPAGQPLWPGRVVRTRGPKTRPWWAWKAADMLRADLDAARAAWVATGATPAERQRREASDVLRYFDAAGEVFDFHSLRVQFISGLALAGVPLTAAQRLADHSTPLLTANVYTKWANELVGEVAKLPGLGTSVGVPVGVLSTSPLQKLAKPAEPARGRRRTGGPGKRGKTA
jgi:integrase